jgi:hypothetical protein
VMMEDTPGQEASIDFALLADAMEVSGDRIHVLGGGWDTLWAHDFPAAIHSLAIGLKLRIPWTKANRRFVVEIDLENEDGLSILGPRRVVHPFEVGRPAGLPPGSDQTLAWGYTFHHLEIPRSGGYSFVIRIDGGLGQRIRFRAVARHGP